MKWYGFISLVGLVGVLLLCHSPHNQNEEVLRDVCGWWKIEKCEIDTTNMLNELFEANSQTSKDSVPTIRDAENALLLATFPEIIKLIQSLHYVEITKEKFVLYNRNKEEVEAYSIQDIEDPPLVLKTEDKNKKMMK